MENRIYNLYVNGPSPLISIEDENFLHHHFLGKSEIDIWTPPRVLISRTSKPLKDVLMGSFQAPFVSHKFKLVMGDVLKNAVEFLPLLQLNNIQYYVFNVIEIVDCLNQDQSDILYAPDELRKILHIRKYIFDSKRVKPVPVFKVPQDFGNIFVTEPFIEVARKAQLTGIGFDDPDKICLVKGKSPVDGFPS